MAAAQRTDRVVQPPLLWWRQTDAQGRGRGVATALGDRAVALSATARFRHERIAIERPSGLIVDVLVEAGFTVTPIHPNIVKATRPRYRSHGGKSDASDAYLLADFFAPTAAGSNR
jgi:hypothetical protein